jgi:hypothetical protein
VEDSIPEYIEPETAYVTISRTTSDDMTTPMYMIDHTVARQDGPPDFRDEEDTVVQEVDWNDY